MQDQNGMRMLFFENNKTNFKKIRETGQKGLG